MSDLRIAIIGVGPRGLSAFERIVARAQTTSIEVSVLLIEPGPLGVGVHRTELPEYLVLNTVAGQATAYSDEMMVPGAPVTPGPDFLAWCRDRGVTVREHGRERSVRYEDFLSRRLFGEYMADAARQLLGAAPPLVEVRLLNTIAVDVRPHGEETIVELADGNRLTVDLAIVTTGHGLLSQPLQRMPPRVIEQCYPLPDAVEAVGPGSRVAVSGMGLAAMDVIAALTVGRGGRFQDDGRSLTYLRAGREPDLVLFSRNGFMPYARPSSPRRGPGPTASHLTTSALEALRAGRATRQITLSEIVSLIERELLADGLTDEETRAIVRVMSTAPTLYRDAGAYQAAVVEQAKWDLAEARKGLGRSAFKDRLERLRDHREVLRNVVDPPGMAAQEHRAFFEYVPALCNRAAVGPEQARIAELLALLDAGVAELGPGPGCELTATADGWLLRSTGLATESSMTADMLIRAHIGWRGILGPSDPLSLSLRRWAALHPADPRSLCLTRLGQVITREGTVCRSVLVSGAPAEGANYYNNYILWPGVWSRALTDLDAALVPLFDRELLGVDNASMRSI